MTIPQQILTIALCVLGTMTTRFLPFFIFREDKETPAFIQYLGTGPHTAETAAKAREAWEAWEAAQRQRTTDPDLEAARPQFEAFLARFRDDSLRRPAWAHQMWIL